MSIYMSIYFIMSQILFVPRQHLPRCKIGGIHYFYFSVRGGPGLECCHGNEMCFFFTDI